ncbi:hypothetical protein MAP00_007321 [Monascus purpureus]|nr:hypothetical protein MAP00_007321 [Monascus purpureus]
MVITSDDPKNNHRPKKRFQVLHSVQIPVSRIHELERESTAVTTRSGYAQAEKTMAGRGRPSKNKKASTKGKIEISVPPNQNVPYQVYSCGWSGCPAELHNLTMLKKHVLKVHLSGGHGATEQLSCKWEGCSFSKNFTPSSLQLHTHVMNVHIEPYAWRLGDGPYVPVTDSSSRPGTQMTILHERNQAVGEDSLIFPASYMSIQAFNRVHGNHSQQEKAKEVLKAVQRLKEQIGVGLDPGGCELATPARNWKLDDEEVYRFVRSE